MALSLASIVLAARRGRQRSKLIPKGNYGLGVDTVIYLLDPSRGHEVPQSHFGPEASGVWTGLTRFVDDPRIPMDNNASERAGRGPAVARKNFYPSSSEPLSELLFPRLLLAGADSLLGESLR